MDGSDQKIAALRNEVHQLTILWADTLQKVCRLESTTRQVADLVVEYTGAWKALHQQPPGSCQKAKVIYIAGAYTDKNPDKVQLNVLAAQFEAQLVMAKGHTVICPHNNFYFAGDDWRGVMNACLDLIHRVDAVLMMKDWEKSLGARCERYAAYATGRTVYYSVRDIPDLNYQIDEELVSALNEIE